MVLNMLLSTLDHTNRVSLCCKTSSATLLFSVLVFCKFGSRGESSPIIFTETTDFILCALDVPGGSWSVIISLDTRRGGVAIQSLNVAVIAIFGRFDLWAFKAYLAVYALAWAMVI